jgi:hypothetical protein
MGNVPTFSPNPFANFDPSQWSNPYSNFYGQALPWPSSYVGAPNDATGAPIPSFTQANNAAQAQYQQALAAYNAGGGGSSTPGTTINSSPYDPIEAAGAALVGPPAGQPTGATDFSGYNQMLSSGQGQNAAMHSVNNGMSPNVFGMGVPAAAAPAGPAPPAPPNMSAAYLSALANPGKVTTPGATVPQSATSYQPGSGVLQQFLANWKPAQSGPGSGFQQGFAKALKGS